MPVLMVVVVVVVAEFFAPSVPFMDSDGMKPEKKLKLEWVYPLLRLLVWCWWWWW